MTCKRMRVAAITFDAQPGAEPHTATHHADCEGCTHRTQATKPGDVVGLYVNRGDGKCFNHAPIVSSTADAGYP